VGEDAALVLVVDDDPDLRQQLLLVLAGAGYECREAGDGAEAIRTAASARPDAVLLDVVMPGISGYEVCRRLRAEHGAELGIMFVSGVRVDPLDRAAGLMLGADDYMTKPLQADELLARLRRLLHARGARVARDDAPSPQPAVARPVAPSPLTARETEVIGLLAGGFDSREIAAALVISPKTVTSHVQRILSKLGVHNRAQAVARAFADGLLPADPADLAPVLDLTDKALTRDTTRHAG
jgi:DNA-binding NarL/FixJ family response regulator